MQPRRQAAAPVCRLPRQVARSLRLYVFERPRWVCGWHRTATFSEAAELRQHFVRGIHLLAFPGLGYPVREAVKDDGITTVRVTDCTPVDSRGDFTCPPRANPTKVLPD
jgi:hypothetical protein